MSLQDRAVKALARSEKTRVELEQLLLDAGSPAQVTAVLDALVAQGLQSDARTALVRARQAAAKGKTAKAALKEISAAGVPWGMAEHAVEGVYAGVDERAQLSAHFEALGAKTDAKLVLKLARALLVKGYDEDHVREHVERRLRG